MGSQRPHATSPRRASSVTAKELIEVDAPAVDPSESSPSAKTDQPGNNNSNLFKDDSSLREIVKRRKSNQVSLHASSSGQVNTGSKGHIVIVQVRTNRRRLPTNGNDISSLLQ